MKSQSVLRKFQFLVISFLLAACSFRPATSTPTPEPTPTVTITPTQTPRPTPTLTPTPFYDVIASETITVKSGGFSFDMIKGYEVVYNEGSTFYAQSDDHHVEVYIAAFLRAGGEAFTTVMKNSIEDLSDEYQDFIGTDPVRTSEDDIDSIAAEFTARNGVFPVEGRILIHEPDRSKLVYILITAEGDQRWQREGQKVFELVRDSLQFFPIVAIEDCGQPKYPEYGKKPERPILIGGGDRLSGSRISSYLDALLGPHEEPISYYRLSDPLPEFPDILIYNVHYRNTYETLFFDPDRYEALTAPLGMKCSAPLPDKP